MGNLCSCFGAQVIELREDGGRFIINFIGASDVPKADLTSESDPYIKAYLLEGNMRSKPYKSLVRDDNRNPVWNSYHDFRIGFNMDAYLKVEIWDADSFSKDGLIGEVVISLKEFQDENVKSFKLSYKIGSPSTNPNFSISLRRVYMNSPPPMRKTIFIMRHGQSKWNQAQSDGKILNLLDIDHALSGEGFQQAERLNGRWKASSASKRVSSDDRRGSFGNTKRVSFLLPNETDINDEHVVVQAGGNAITAQSSVLPDDLEALFASSGQIYSSPLTRAIQTALVSLQGHPALEAKGLTLFSIIREAKKSVGGLDCVGCAVGDDIKTRVTESLSEIAGDGRALEICAPVFNVNDCSVAWWTGKMNSETSANITCRVHEFLKHIQYTPVDSAIYVGHSLFFKELCSNLVGSVLRKKSPEVAENMTKHKLANASVLAITIVFPDQHLKQTTTKPFAEDACLMFESSFDMADLPEEDELLAKADVNSAASPFPSSAVGVMDVELVPINNRDNRL